MILSGNRPGNESSGWGFSLDEEEKVSGRHLHEQGKSFPCLTLVFTMFLIQFTSSCLQCFRSSLPVRVYNVFDPVAGV